jgi:hypothetical protein
MKCHEEVAENDKDKLEQRSLIKLGERDEVEELIEVDLVERSCINPDVLKEKEISEARAVFEKHGIELKEDFGKESNKLKGEDDEMGIMRKRE